MKERELVQRVSGKAVIEAGGGILVLHPSGIDLNRNWHIPGGIRDDIREPLEDTAKREALEETGIDLTRVTGKVVKIGEWSAVDKGEAVRILAVFFLYSLKRRPEIVLSAEHDNSAWLNAENYHKYPANQEVYDLVEMLLKAR